MQEAKNQLSNRRICLLGGTGFVGSHLKRHLQSFGYKVYAYGREAFKDQTTLVKAIDDCGTLIVLVGENIGKRWSAAYKQALFDSRIRTNQQIAEALAACAKPPQRILSASAIGIYPQNDCQHPLDESCHEVGDNFLGELGQAWEESSKQLKPQPVIMRFGVVLGEDGGALQKMLPAFKLGLGGPVAGGQQCFSWVHIDDLTSAIQFLLEEENCSGIYNLCAPNPLSNKEFGGVLAETLKRPFWLPLPEWQLKLMFGEGAQVLTHSSAIVPTRITQAGFKFQYETAESALAQLLS